jgi:hypothetical protein
MNALSACRCATRMLTAASLVGLLAGCASPQAALEPKPAATDLALQACMRVTAARNMLLVEVPAAGNGLANRLAVLALKAGPSTTAETLSRVLVARQRPVLVVYGESPDLAVATLEAALGAVPANSASGQSPVCVAGLAEAHTSVTAKARAAGVVLIAVPQP